MKTKKIVLIALLTALSVVLSITESFIPIGIPGVKIGLSNVVTLVVLYLYSWKEALLVHYFRILIVGLTYTGLFSTGFMISLSGGTLAIVAMLILHRFIKERIFTISSGAALFHSIGQIVCCMIIMKSVDIAYYLLIMSLLSIASGLLTASLSYLVLRYLGREVERVNVVSIVGYSIIMISMVLFSVILITRKTNGANGVAKVYDSGELVLSINLSNPSVYDKKEGFDLEYRTDGERTYFIFESFDSDKKDYDTIKILVEDGRIRIIENDCKSKTCVRSGFISESYERIICTPTGVLIKIVTSGSDLDALI